MANAKLESLLNKRAVVLDGGMGTEFQRLGVPAGTHPDLLNLSEPDLVRQIIKSYADAGSDVVLTNTFGSNRFVLEKHGEADKLADVNRAAAEIARKIADETAARQVLVFGDLGPTGVMLALGEVPESAIFDAYAEQIAALKKAGVKLYFLACGNTDFLFQGAEDMHRKLEEQGLQHEYFVSDGGHVWSNWRLYLNTFAQKLFK